MYSGKVLVINECCSDNIGDHAINEGIKSLLTANGLEPVCIGFDAELKIVSPTKIDVNEGIKDKLRKIKYKYITSNIIVKYPRWIIKNNKRMAAIDFSIYRFVIIGGGQLLQSGGSFPIALFKWVTEIKRAGVPVYILGVGCAEKFGKIDKQLIRTAINRSNALYLREKKSIQKVKSFFSVDASYIPDLAYSLYSKISPTNNMNDKYVIVGATSYYVYTKNIKEINKDSCKSLTEYIQMWIEIIKKEVLSGEKVVLVSTTVDDAALNEYIFNTAEIKALHDSVSIIEKLTPLQEYLNVLSGAKRIYSGRMHSLILGHINGCEIQPIRLNKKIDYYIEEYSGRSPEEIKNEIDNVFKGINKDFKC